nr:hypothetical protein [Myxococcales bacterium]
QLVQLCAREAQRFQQLEAFHLGQSAHLRHTSVPGLLVQRLVPSLNSISQGRKGTVDGTASLRLDISSHFWSRLHERGIATCHLARHGATVLVTQEQVPRVEVIVKAALVGTPTRIYDGLLQQRDRFGQPFLAGHPHAPYVRFDYRNPLQDASGEGLRDECLPLALADRLIDTGAARHNALATFALVRDTLAQADLHVLDACFLFDETGQTLCYEVSPDNMRIKSASEDFDKDLWRNHAPPATIVERWGQLLQRLETL